MVIAFPKIYAACHTDENGIKPGINLNTTDKRVAEPSRAFGQKIFCIRCLNGPYKNVSRISSLFGKSPFFPYTGKNYTSIRF